MDTMYKNGRNGNVPNFSFEGGLRIRQVGYEKDGSENVSEEQWTHEELANLPNVGDDPVRDARVMEQFQSSRYVSRLGNIATEYAVFGNPSSEDVHLMFYGWGSHMDNPVIAQSPQAMVANKPDGLFVFTNPPGIGRSSSVPSLGTEMKKGSYLPYGELVAEALRDVTDGRDVHVGGHSLGARHATATTPFINGGQGVESLVLNDPPGSIKTNLAAVVARLLVIESYHAGQYMRNGFNKNPIPRSIDDFRNVVGGVGWHQISVDPSGVSHPNFGPELRKAVDHVRREVRVLLPELSRLNDWRAIAGIVGRVRETSDTDARIGVGIVEEHSHVWLMGAKNVEAMMFSGVSQPSEAALPR